MFFWISSLETQSGNPAVLWSLKLFLKFLSIAHKKKITNLIDFFRHGRLFNVVQCQSNQSNNHGHEKQCSVTAGARVIWVTQLIWHKLRLSNRRNAQRLLLIGNWKCILQLANSRHSSRTFRLLHSDCFWNNRFLSRPSWHSNFISLTRPLD